MKIQLIIDQPMPKPGCCDKPDTLEDKVEAACDLIDSGHESREEWDFVRALNNELVKRKQKGRLGPRGAKLMEMMAKVINKYADEDPRGVDQDPELAMK